MAAQNLRHRGSHLTELFDSIRNEFEALAHEANVNKMQKEDLERRVTAQLAEMTNIQTAVFELERAHNKLKQQYEEDLRRNQHPYGNGSGPMNGGGDAYIEKTGPPMGNGFGPSGFLPGPHQPPHGPPGVPPPQQLPPTQQPHHPPPDHHHPNKRQRSNGPEQPPTQEHPHEQISYNSQQLPPPQQMQGGPLPGPFDPSFSKAGGFNAPLPKPGDSKEGIPSNPSSLVLSSIGNPNASPAFGANPTMKNPRQNVPSLVEMQESISKPMENKHYVEDKDGPNSDWVIGYHPNVQPNMTVELAHTLDHSSVVCCVKFSNDGKYLATGSNRSANIFNIDSGEKIHVFDGSHGPEAPNGADQYIRSVCFSSDGKLLATGGEDRTVKVWDIERKSISHTFSGHTHEIYSLDFSQKSNLIVSGGGDHKIRVWDLDSRKCLFELGGDGMGPKDGVTSVAFSPDGRFIAAGSLDYVVRLWETHTGYFLDRFEGHTDSVYSVAFSPDGKSLASGSLDKTLKLWDLSNSKQKARATFTGHKDYVLSVAFSPEGNWLVSGSKDRTVQFWDPRNAMANMMLQGHKNSVISVAMSPASGALATGSGDNRARIWKYRTNNV